MSVLTLITVLVVAYGVLGSGGYGRALALGGATAAGSAIAVGGTAVPTFYAVALGTVVALVLRMLGNGRSPAHHRDPLPPGGSLLVLFAVWSGVVTLVAPFLFDGMAIVTPTAKSLVAGAPTSSNLAQIIYLAVGICTVIFLARSSATTPQLIGLLTGTCTLLSLWRYLHQIAGFPFPEGLFDNSPSFAYIETAPNDVQRFRGILSEPAGLAGSSIITIGYMVPRAVQLRGLRRFGALVVAGIALYLGVISTSATFVIAGVALAVIAALAYGLRFLARRTSFSAIVSLVGCAAVIVGIWVLPVIADFVETTVNEKLASSSYDERSYANSASLEVFLNTFGFGVGVGSARASSFLPTLLSATGLPGTLLFAAAVVTLILRGSADPRYRPVVWALVTLLVVKIAAGPDLSDSSGVMWISLGLLSRAAMTAESGDRRAFLQVAGGGRESVRKAGP